MTNQQKAAGRFETTTAANNHSSAFLPFGARPTSVKINRLTLHPAWPDTWHVANKDATEFDSSNTHSGQTAQRGFFTSVYPGAPSMVALGGEASGLAGGCVCRSVNPIQCRHPRLTASRGLTATHGAHMPSKISPKQSPKNALKAVSKPDVITLTPDELLIIRTYRATNENGQDFFNRVLPSWPKNYPRRVSTPFRLIVGGVK